MEIIGEACGRITSTFKEQCAQIEWKQLTAFRNISVHEYFAVDLKIVFQLATKDVLDLKQKFEDCLRSGSRDTENNVTATG